MPLSPDPYNLIISGIGGQGNILLSRLVGRLMFRAGYQVSIGETFGAAQRGGGVFSGVRISSKRLYGPIVPQGAGNMIISLEPLEALRMISQYGNPGVKALVNSEGIHPVAVLSQKASYPSDEAMSAAIHKATDQAWLFNATKIALELDAPIAVNIVMLGGLVATGALPLDADEVADEVKASVPPHLAELNLTAYRRGMGAVSGA